MELQTINKAIIDIKNRIIGVIVMSVEHIEIILPTTVFDKVMDAEYIATNIAGGNHRLFDGGHTLLGAWKTTVTISDNYFDHFKGWTESILKDLFTPKGLPFITIKPDTYNKICNATKKLGLDRSDTYDMLSYTPVEIFGIVLSIPTIARKTTIHNVTSHTAIGTILTVIAVRCHSVPAGILACIQIVKIARVAIKYRETRKTIVISCSLTIVGILLTIVNPFLGIAFTIITNIPISWYKKTLYLISGTIFRCIRKTKLHYKFYHL